MRLQIHPNGPNFSKLSAGMWRLNEWNLNVKELIQFIEGCIDLGITTFDHADIYGDYGNESLFGKTLKEQPKLREKIELVSKCGICLLSEHHPQHEIQHYNTTSSHIKRSVEGSLKKLHTDYLDLVLIHRPDPLMEASEMADVFMNLIDEGKIKHVGVSNFTPSQSDLFQSKMDVPLVTNQIECSLLHTKPLFDGTLDQAQQMGASPMVWSPFGGGRMFNDNSEQGDRVRKLCSQLSDKYESEEDQIALSWIMMLPSKPLPVLGTGKLNRMKSAVDSLSITLERQDWFKLLEAARGYGVA